MKDILIPYLATQTGDELRYCLRSIEANVTHGKIYIVGGKQNWFSDKLIHIPKPLAPYKYMDAELNIREGLKHISKSFYLFNDDIFVFKDFKNTKTGIIPNYDLGSLTDCLKERIERTGKSDYTNAIQSTIDWCGTAAVNYSAHTPMIMESDKRKYISDRLLHYMENGNTYLTRSVYGNYYAIPSTTIEDVKIHDMKTATIPEVGIVSTTHYSFDYGEIGKVIKNTFPNKSKYEL